MGKIISCPLLLGEGRQFWLDGFCQSYHLFHYAHALNQAEFSHVKLTEPCSSLVDLFIRVVLRVCQDACRLDCFEIKLLAEFQERLSRLRFPLFSLKAVIVDLATPTPPGSPYF